LNITALAVPQRCWLDRNRARRDKTIAARCVHLTSISTDEASR